MFMNRIVLAVLAAAAVALTGTAGAQQRRDFSKVEVKTTDLGHDTYMLQGEGGNMTVAVAKDGVILVDSEFAPLHDKIKAAIAALSPLKVRYVVNTHFHGDHTGGDAAFAAEGAVVVAHENVRKRLAAGTINGLTGAKTPPAPAKALPTRTYADSMMLKLEGRTAELRHFPNAHTDGDTYVHFPDADVLATGDIVTLGTRYPNIDFANGGGIDGMIAGIDGYLKMVSDRTRIVPGHGPLTNRAKLIEYRAMLANARGRVAKLIAAGRSESEAVAAKPFADIQARIGATDQASANFVRVIYSSLKRG
jgi:glyoxylase-like metal-dependent hydrolase (beta-lactamase superfamily II)